MHAIEIVLAVAAIVCALLGLFQVPSKVNWAALAALLVAVAVALFLAHAHL